MKKRILLIGNDDGLPGVKVDLKNYRSYFKSNIGGAWEENEIIEKLNPKKDDLIRLLEILKDQSLDYLITVYSGHGGQKRSTVLELNPDGELFSETSFEKIAKRQLTILDCCRAYITPITDDIFESRRIEKAFSAYDLRKKFEDRILQALPQEIKLYACKEGEYSYDSSEGGIYSVSLLTKAIQDKSEYIGVGVTHEKAAEITTIKHSDQHPDMVIPRLLSSQLLILGVN